MDKESPMKSKAEIDVFKKLRMQVSNILDQFTELSKKKPDGPVNKFKLKLVNDLLTTANKIMPKERRPFPDFETFEEDDLPSNSDVVVILSQYLSCIGKFETENKQRFAGKSYWIIRGKRSEVEV